MADVAPLRTVATEGMPYAQARQIRQEFTRFLMEYQFAVDEVLTKVSILREEYQSLHNYNPIEHVSSRLKTPDSILEKVERRGLPISLDAIRDNITDIAGIRITCSFIADTYRVFEALSSQNDVKVLKFKDYIAHPKSNGYRSLHAILQIPVFLSTGPVLLPVEVQIRTVAMDFWASLEHKISYKYSGAVPDDLVERLTAAARAADQLDHEMAQLHAEVHHSDPVEDSTENDRSLIDRLRGLFELHQGQLNGRSTQEPDA